MAQPPDEPAHGRAFVGAGSGELAARARGLLPVTLLAVLAAAILAASGVPPVTILAYGAYLIVLVTLPGMLWVRLLRRHSGHLAEDMALGFAAGSCVQIAAYLGARAVGLPQAHVGWA